MAALQADGARWNVPVRNDRPDDIEYVADVIDHMAARVCTDLTRIYVHRVLGRRTHVVAVMGAGSVRASRPSHPLPDSGGRHPARGRPVPVLSFHGLADRQNPYAGKAAGRGAEWLESVPDALAGWARHNGCDLDVILDNPGGPLSTIRYEGCDAGADVRMVRIDSLGHTWAKEEVDATAVMWRFFSGHRLRQ